MIASKPLPYRITTEALGECADQIAASGVPDLLEECHRRRGRGTGRPAGVRFSLLAVLACGLVLVRIGRVPSIAEIYRVIASLDDQQLALVGMAGQQPDPDGYRAFAAWLTRHLQPLDSGADIPARRVSNREHASRMAARTPEQVEAASQAAALSHEVVNRLVHASIDDLIPQDYKGDVVADETIIDLAKAGNGLGTRPEKNRGAASCAEYYVRDKRGVPKRTGSSEHIRKAAIGIGVTAVARIGEPKALHKIPPVITGIAIHKPTSGSVQGLEQALTAHRLRCAPPQTVRSRWPHLIVDMGYNQKRGFTASMVAQRLSPVVRYPAHWRTALPHPDASLGPVQIAGAFYCPAAAEITAAQSMVRKTADLLDRDEFRRQDALLRRVLPLMMGTNSRPHFVQRRSGRPRKDETDQRAVAQEFVCPAVQGRVVCPLKPGSELRAADDAPRLSPSWEASRYACCSKSQVKITFSEAQVRMAQWGLPAGSWEHALLYEAARSLTEQRFSISKSHHTSGFNDLSWSPRREPMIKLIIALQFMEANRVIQRAWERRDVRVDSWHRRWKQLQDDVGSEPMRIPART